jgi:hypothetical protein
MGLLGCPPRVLVDVVEPARYSLIYGRAVSVPRSGRCRKRQKSKGKTKKMLGIGRFSRNGEGCRGYLGCQQLEQGQLLSVGRYRLCEEMPELVEGGA